VPIINSTGSSCVAIVAVATLRCGRRRRLRKAPPASPLSQLLYSSQCLRRRDRRFRSARSLSRLDSSDTRHDQSLTHFGDRRQGQQTRATARRLLEYRSAAHKVYGCNQPRALNNTYQRRRHVRAWTSARSARDFLSLVSPTAGRRGAPPRQSARAPSSTRSERATRCADSRAEHRAVQRPGLPRRGLLHEDRLDPPTRCTSSRAMDGIRLGARRPTTMARGPALVMELARVFSGPGVQTERNPSRFILLEQRGSASTGAPPT